METVVCRARQWTTLPRILELRCAPSDRRVGSLERLYDFECHVPSAQSRSVAISPVSGDFLQRAGAAPALRQRELTFLDATPVVLAAPAPRRRRGWVKNRLERSRLCSARSPSLAREATFQDSIVEKRAQVDDAEQRFSLALLLNARSRKEILRLGGEAVDSMEDPKARAIVANIARLPTFRPLFSG